jgi:hypothetical protein
MQYAGLSVRSDELFAKDVFNVAKTMLQARAACACACACLCVWFVRARVCVYVRPICVRECV